MLTSLLWVARLTGALIPVTILVVVIGILVLLSLACSSSRRQYVLQLIAALTALIRVLIPSTRGDPTTG
jgi:hypothetical protein